MGTVNRPLTMYRAVSSYIHIRCAQRTGGTMCTVNGAFKGRGSLFGAYNNRHDIANVMLY